MSVLTAFKNFDELKSKAMEGVVFFFPVKYCVCDASMLMFGYIQYRKKVNGKTTRTYFAADCLDFLFKYCFIVPGIVHGSLFQMH